MFIVLALAAGCAPRPLLRPADAAALAAQARREAQLAAIERWSLRGRIAVSHAGDGGSGQLLWRQDEDRTMFELRAPVSRQTWRLIAGAEQARIEGLEGGPRSGRDAQTLLRDEVGWSVPLDNLSAWARGMRGAGPATIQFDANGLPATIEQAAWRIEYRGWHSQTDPPLPSRVFASSGDQRVRLAIERWELGR